MSARVGRAVLELTTDTTEFEEGLDEVNRRLDELEGRAKRTDSPLRRLDGGLKDAAKSAHDLAKPLKSEVTPALDDVEKAMEAAEEANRRMLAALGLVAGAAGLVAVAVGKHLLEAWKKSAEEAEKFQSALDSMDTHKIQAEIDRLMKKLDEAQKKIRFLQGPAGDPGAARFPNVVDPDFPFNLGTAPLTGGEAARDKALNELEQLRQRKRESESDDSKAFTEGEKKLGQDRVKAFEEEQRKKEQARKEEQRKERELIEAGTRGWVAMAEAKFKATEDEQRAIVKLNEHLFNEEKKNDEKILDAWDKKELERIKAAEKTAEELEKALEKGRKSETAAAEHDVREHFDTTKKLADIDEERFRKTKERRDAFVDEFSLANASISSGIASILTTAQTVEQAFEQMGRTIAAGLIQNVIERGLKVVEKALFDFLEELQKSGLLKAFIQGVVGAGVSVGTSSLGAETFQSGGGGIQTFQHGGIVAEPMFASIGETGPEAVIPLEHGAVPVRMLGGDGGGGVTVNVFNQAPGTGVEQSQQRGNMGEVIHNIVIKEVNRSLASGEFDRSFGSTFGSKRQPVER
jgi:hypothetical protein